MKKVFLLVAFIILFANTAFANVYYISELNNVKLVSDYSASTNAESMDRVKLGYMADANGMIDMEWFVLDRKDGKALLFAAKNVLKKQYHDDGSWQNASTWADSNLREYMNGEFLDDELILESVRNYICDTELETYDYFYYEGTKKESNTVDKIFPLSRNEIKEYFNVDDNFYFRDNRVKPIGNNSDFWLRGLLDNDRSVQSYHVGIEGTHVSKNFGNSHSVWVRPAMWVDIAGIKSVNLNKPKKQNTEETTVSNSNVNTNNNSNTQQKNNKTKTKKYSDTIEGLPSRQSELRSDNHFYLDNNMQKSTWVYYVTYYYHVDGQGNIEKSKWVEQRYVGADGRMYRGRKTPDGKWVGDNGLVVNVTQDLSNSLTIEASEPDSWYRTQSGLWYYFENDRTTTKKGWFHDTRDDQWYYLDPTTGIMAVGWTNIDGSMYYFNESHDNEPNWYEVGGGFYESYNKKVKAYGSMFCNEQTPDGQYVDENGRLVTNQAVSNVANNTSNNTNNITNSAVVNNSKSNQTNSKRPIQKGDKALIKYVMKHNGEVIESLNDYYKYWWLEFDEGDYNDEDWFQSVLGHYVGDNYVFTTYKYYYIEADQSIDKTLYGEPVDVEIMIYGVQVEDWSNVYDSKYNKIAKPKLLYGEYLNDDVYKFATERYQDGLDEVMQPIVYN